LNGAQRDFSKRLSEFPFPYPLGLLRPLGQFVLNLFRKTPKPLSSNGFQLPYQYERLRPLRRPVVTGNRAGASSKSETAAMAGRPAGEIPKRIEQTSRLAASAQGSGAAGVAY
jgi:hypothetical protein